VKFHLSNVYRKLEVTNRTEASRWAQVNGLLEDGAGVA
jgi:DNA-binding CsgD family transcriptional regulator